MSILVPEEKIQQRVDELAKLISADYEGKTLDVI